MTQLKRPTLGRFYGQVLSFTPPYGYHIKLEANDFPELSPTKLQLLTDIATGLFAVEQVINRIISFDLDYYHRLRTRRAFIAGGRLNAVNAFNHFLESQNSKTLQDLTAYALDYIARGESLKEFMGPLDPEGIQQMAFDLLQQESARIETYLILAECELSFS